MALVLSLKPWLRLFPAALTEPLGGMSPPAVDTLAVGPGSLMERDRQERGEKEEKEGKKGGCKQAKTFNLYQSLKVMRLGEHQWYKAFISHTMETYKVPPHFLQRQTHI